MWQHDRKWFRCSVGTAYIKWQWQCPIFAVDFQTLYSLSATVSFTSDQVHCMVNSSIILLEMSLSTYPITWMAGLGIVELLRRNSGLVLVCYCTTSFPFVVNGVSNEKQSWLVYTVGPSSARAFSGACTWSKWDEERKLLNIHRFNNQFLTISRMTYT